MADELRSHYPLVMSPFPGAGLQIFRPRRVLAIAMALAGALWVGVLIYLLRMDGVPWKTYASAAFFAVFFAVALVYYGRTAIFVDQGGLTFRGMVRTYRLSFSEIRKLDILPGPVTVYAIRSGGRFLHFTSFFRHHQLLANLLVERAGLASARS